MSDFNSDLMLLESLSKKISDLIYNNEFSQISEIDTQRKLIIKKLKENQTHNFNIKARIRNLVENNIANIQLSESKLDKLSKNHNKFHKRIKAYSFNK